ncbi:unnamed protein product, partial [Didymodactylos carnosus]
TETDIDTQAPALIQLLLIPHEIRASSALVIILIETQFLPPKRSTRRQRIQELCSKIFQPTHLFYGWGELDDELMKFSEFELFKSSDIMYAENVQQIFRRMYNANHPHDYNCQARWEAEDGCLLTTAAPYDMESDDHPDCTCPDRPYKDPRQPNS